MAVFPLWNGSHAKPPLGSKFLVVGLRVQKERRRTLAGAVVEHDEFTVGGLGVGTQGSGVYGVGMTYTSPCISVGIVDISYRNPRFKVRLLRIRQSSCTYPPKTLSRR